MGKLQLTARDLVSLTVNISQVPTAQVRMAIEKDIDFLPTAMRQVPRGLISQHGLMQQSRDDGLTAFITNFKLMARYIDLMKSVVSREAANHSFGAHSSLECW